jgi:hypothetical protein
LLVDRSSHDTNLPSTHQTTIPYRVDPARPKEHYHDWEDRLSLASLGSQFENRSLKSAEYVDLNDFESSCDEIVAESGGDWNITMQISTLCLRPRQDFGGGRKRTEYEVSFKK